MTALIDDRAARQPAPRSDRGDRRRAAEVVLADWAPIRPANALAELARTRGVRSQTRSPPSSKLTQSADLGRQRCAAAKGGGLPAYTSHASRTHVVRLPVAGGHAETRSALCSRITAGLPASLAWAARNELEREPKYVAAFLRVVAAAVVAGDRGIRRIRSVEMPHAGRADSSELVL